MTTVVLDGAYDPRDTATVSVHALKDEKDIFEIYFNGTYQSSAYTNRKSLTALRDMIDSVLKTEKKEENHGKENGSEADQSTAG